MRVCACQMPGDRGGHHDAQSLVAPAYPTLEACYSRASKSPLYKILFDQRLLCVFFCLWHVCVLRVAIQACVWHRKGCDGNAVFQTGYRHGSETLATVLGCGKTPPSSPESTPSYHNKHPAICRSAGMPPIARVLAWTTALPTVWGHRKKRSRMMSPGQQQQQTEPHKNSLSSSQEKTHSKISTCYNSVVLNSSESVLISEANERL